MCFLLILVAFGVFNVLYSEELTENSRQVFPVAIIPTEEIQPGNMNLCIAPFQM